MARRVRRGVKARRVVRRFELWSVAKLALVFHLFCYALTVTVLVVLWNVAFKLGTITKLETFLSDFGFSDKATKQDFRLHGDAIFRAGTMAGLGLVALNTLVTVMLAFFYNGVSGLFGGVVVSVLEERPPLSPAERRAVAADGRGERLALPSGGSSAGSSGGAQPVDDKRLSRRKRRKRERIAEAASKAEAAAVRLAEVPAVPAKAGSSTRRKRKSTGPTTGTLSRPAVVAETISPKAPIDAAGSATTKAQPSEPQPSEAKSKSRSKGRNGAPAAKRVRKDAPATNGNAAVPELRSNVASDRPLSEALSAPLPERDASAPVGDVAEAAEVAAGVQGPSGT